MIRCLCAALTRRRRAGGSRSVLCSDTSDASTPVCSPERRSGAPTRVRHTCTHAHTHARAHTCTHTHTHTHYGCQPEASLFFPQTSRCACVQSSAGSTLLITRTSPSGVVCPVGSERFWLWSERNSNTVKTNRFCLETSYWWPSHQLEVRTHTHTHTHSSGVGHTHCL